VSTNQPDITQVEAESWINKNKNLVIAGVVGLMLAVAGYSFWKSQSEKAYQAELNSIYQFKLTLQKYVETKDGEKADSNIWTEFDQLVAGLTHFEPLLPVVLELVEAGKNAGEKEKAINALSVVINKYQKTSYSYYFAARTLAALYEETNNFSSAIELLESLNKERNALLPAKNYLDLGRLYGLSGDNAKAKSNLEYLIENYPNDSWIRLAKLMLKDLN